MSARVLLLALILGDSIPLRADLADAIRFYGAGEYNKAVEVLSKNTPQSTKPPDYDLWLGKSYLRLRRWDDAIREFERAVLVDPTSSLYHMWLGRAYGRKAEHTVFFLSALGPARRLLKEFKTAVRLSPGNVDAHFDLLEFYLDAPEIIGGGRDHARAEVAQIARINPRLGMTAQARVYEDEKKYDLAREELVRETVKFPDQAGSFTDLADFFFRRMNYAEAAPIALKSVEMSTPPNRKAQLVLLASWVRLNKNLEKAEDGLEALSRGPLLDDDPPFEDVYYWLGQARLALGKKSEARQSFEAALRFNPDDSRAKAAMGQLR